MGFWPSALSEVLGNTSGKYTGGVTGVDTGTINGTASGYSVQATMKSANVNAAITGKMVRLLAEVPTNATGLDVVYTYRHGN